ncbi:MAG TPA: hypothetical protein VF970_06145 [Gemmatimonadales bacterium]
MNVRVVLPPTEADWRREARVQLWAALEAARCAAELLMRVAGDPHERELAHAVSVALARAELAARRAGGWSTWVG